MPLTRFELRNEYGIGDPELYKKSACGKEGAGAEFLLHGIAVSGIVGILRQLGDVAEFGAEIFHDLHEQLMITSARGHKMLSRIKKMENAIPYIEDAVHRKGSYIDLAYENGSDWHADLRLMDSHLSCDDLPQFIIDSYEDCRDPPSLYLLDKYDRAGNGACLKRYSDPSYFKRAWATSEPEKAKQIQKEKKLKKIKRKFSRVREVQDQIFTSQCNRTSLESSPRFAPLSNDDQSFSAENSPVSEMRLKSEVPSEQLMDTMKLLNCTGKILETNHVVIGNAPEYDRLSVSNVQNKHDHTDSSQLHNDEIVFDVDDDSQYDFLHWKSTSRSPSVIWDEKSKVMKAADLNLSDDTQYSKPLFVDSESSKVLEHTGSTSLNQAKTFPIIANFPRSSYNQNQFEEANDTENYVDALNTLESEAGTDSDCQAKCMQSLSKMEDHQNKSEIPSIAQCYGYSNIELPMSLHDSSNKCRLLSDTQEAGLSPGSPYDGGQLLENTVLTISKTNAFHGTFDDQHSWSTNAKSETVQSCAIATGISQIQTTPPISISNVPCSKLWTNGNLLGLEPSKPVHVSLSNRADERTPSSCMSNGVKSDKEKMANGLIPNQLNSIGKVLGLHESLSSGDQRILNSNPFLSRKYLMEKNSSMKHSSSYVGHNDDVFDIQQNCGKQSEAHSFSEREGSQAAFPNLLGASVSQAHQTTKSVFSKEFEPCSSFSVTSLSIDSVQNSKSSSCYSGLPQTNLEQSLQVKSSYSYPKSSTQYEQMNDDYNQSEEKPLVHYERKRLNEVASRTFSEQNPASRTFHEQTLINKTDYGLLEKSTSSGSPYSQNSSPPLMHIKISFQPMNSLESSNLKLELPDGCMNERIDGNTSPSFRLFSGCTLPSHSASESDEDTFCKSYPYSTEDLLSAHSDSNSEHWEQDDYPGSKMNETSDDLRRISSSTTSIPSYSGFEQLNLVNKEIGLKDICTGNDANSFQPCYITNIPTFESLINQELKYDSLSISPKNGTTLAPTELPPPPPLPPIQWRLVKPSYDISEEYNYSNIAQMVNNFKEPQNQKPPAPTEIENIIQWPLPLAEDQQNKNMHDSQKLDNLLQTHELDRREKPLHQMRDMKTQYKQKPIEESKDQVASSGVAEEDLLHQIRTKTFNLRRPAASRPRFVTKPTTNDRVAAILEKANAIRQACTSSDDDDDDWSDS